MKRKHAGKSDDDVTIEETAAASNRICTLGRSRLLFVHKICPALRPSSPSPTQAKPQPSLAKSSKTKPNNSIMTEVDTGADVSDGLYALFFCFLSDWSVLQCCRRSRAVAAGCPSRRQRSDGAASSSRRMLLYSAFSRSLYLIRSAN